MSGAIAGGVECTVVWPLEYIKTTLQLSSKANPVPYKGMVEGLQWTVKNNGVMGLYRGLAPTLIGSIPKAGIRFGLNAEIKSALKDKDGNLTPAKNFVAGLGAGVMEALIIVCPVETIKTKCIDLNKPFIEGMKIIIKNDGFAGIYQGAASTAMKQGSNQGLRFMWFNEYKDRVKAYNAKDGGKGDLSSFQNLLGGMSAGCFSTLGNNPFDVVKTRMQGTRAAQYSSTLDCFRQILSQEGFSALYAGLIPRLSRVVPGQGVIFMSFELIQNGIRTIADV
jgi:solute carrier family 25 citrate transporter 1